MWKIALPTIRIENIHLLVCKLIMFLNNSWWSWREPTPRPHGNYSIIYEAYPVSIFNVVTNSTQILAKKSDSTDTHYVSAIERVQHDNLVRYIWHLKRSIARQSPDGLQLKTKQQQPLP